MNQLSWLIYLADVAKSSEGWFAFFGWVSSIIAILALVVWAIYNMTYTETDRWGDALAADVVAGKKAERTATNKAVGKLMGIFFPVAFLTITLTVVIPSKDTLYAIAASELGEQVATSDIGLKAGAAIEAWLDRQINETRAAAANAAQPDQPAASTTAG